MHACVSILYPGVHTHTHTHTLSLLFAQPYLPIYDTKENGVGGGGGGTKKKKVLLISSTS